MLLAGTAVSQAHAEPESLSTRSRFPGRRVGGGTRGECVSRLIAHLVPERNVFSPGDAALIAILEGPSENPVSLDTTFRAYQGQVRAAQQAENEGSREIRKTLPASTVGITLLSSPEPSEPWQWSSGYACDSDQPATSSNGSFSFVSAGAPPALSLLQASSSADAEDMATRQFLKQLRASCGTTVATSAIATQFDLTDVITSEWPERLTVRCHD